MTHFPSWPEQLEQVNKQPVLFIFHWNNNTKLPNLQTKNPQYISLIRNSTLDINTESNKSIKPKQIQSIWGPIRGIGTMPDDGLNRA